MTAQAASSVTGFSAPLTLEEAIAEKEALGSGGVYLAGGTDLAVLVRRRRVTPTHLVSLAAIAELQVLLRAGAEVIVGGAVTHRRIEGSELFAGPLEALREACRTVGSVQTRNVGTIGGNLANASPAADTVPVLLALGASVEIAGPGSARLIAVDEFPTGYRATVLGQSEVIVAVRIPVGDGTRGSAFEKLGRRRAMEISIACAAARIDLAGDGSVAAAGIGLGSVAPTAVRAVQAERVLVGSRLDAATAQRAGEAALEACAPIDDVRATAAYRAAVVPHLVARAVLRAAARAGGDA